MKHRFHGRDIHATPRACLDQNGHASQEVNLFDGAKRQRDLRYPKVVTNVTGNTGKFAHLLLVTTVYRKNESLIRCCGFYRRGRSI